MPGTKPKRILVHTYRDDVWIATEEFPSISEASRILRSRGWAFRNDPLNRLGNKSRTYQNGNLYAEVEEALDESDNLTFEGSTYEPVKEWCETNGLTVRQARYAYKTGRLQGMTVGNRNYLYIRKAT